MATTNIGNLVTSDSTFNLAKASAKLYVEVIEKDPILKIMKQYGLVNIENKLSQDAGDTVNMYNLLRTDSQGVTGDHDRYSNAENADYGNRELKINLLAHSQRWKKRGTVTQQIAPFDLKEGRGQIMTNWMRTAVTASIMNQAGGNTATSITIPTLSSSAFTGTDPLLRVTGFNTAVAPTSTYKAIGSRGVGSITADENVDADNVLKLSDFMDMREVITSSTAGLPLWSLIGDNSVQAVAFVSTTGMNQLKNDAVTTGQGLNVAQTFYATAAGGKKMGLDQFILENILFVEVPDYLMPRGVHSSTAAAVAATRRAVVMGANAVDVAFGKGYTSASGEIFPGFSVDYDDNYKKLNKETYASVEANWGCKKARIFGQGANSGTAYDLGTYVITHYSRT